MFGVESVVFKVGGKAEKVDLTNCGEEG